MSDITFYFVRHGYSCSNLNRKRINKMDEKSGDGHLTNWGILSSIYAGSYLQETFYKDIEFDYTLCSPLIRTWETAACMFSNNYNNFTVGPFLNEIIDNKSIKKPYEYDINKKRYEQFVDYISLTGHKSMTYITKELDNGHIIKKQINNIKKFKINYNKNKYLKIYTGVGDLEKFIWWFIDNVNTSKKLNVLVICHNTLMTTFLDKYYNSSNYKYNILYTNNFSFKVSVFNNIIQQPVIYFLGIKNPIGKEENIDVNCSLCNLDKCPDKIKKTNKNLHLNLIKNKDKYLL